MTHTHGQPRPEHLTKTMKQKLFFHMSQYITLHFKVHCYKVMKPHTSLPSCDDSNGKERGL